MNSQQSQDTLTNHNDLLQKYGGSKFLPNTVAASAEPASTSSLAHFVPTSSSSRPPTGLELLYNPEMLETDAQGAWMTLTPRLFPPFYQKAGWRKGKWLEEEEAYTKKLIEAFNAGYLNLPSGTTLRCFLSERLSCDPMRITKKFAGSSCIGKQIYAPCDSRTDPQLVIKAQNELKDLEERFRAKVDVQRAIDYYPVSPVSLAALQQQQHLPQGYRIDNLPPEYLLALQNAGLAHPMLYRGAVGEQSIPCASAARSLSQGMVSSSVSLAPELTGMKHAYRPLQGSTGDLSAKLTDKSRVDVGKNGLGFPLYPAGMVAEPATAARVLGLRPYPGVGLAVPGGLPIVGIPAGMTIPATMVSNSAKAASNNPSPRYGAAASVTSNVLPQPSSTLALGSSSKIGGHDDVQGVDSMTRKCNEDEETKKASFLSLTNKDLYASHLLMNFFHSAASKDSNSEGGSMNSDEQEAATSSKNGHQSNGSMQQTDGDGTSSSLPSESDGAQEDSSHNGNGGGNRHRRHSSSSVGDNNTKERTTGSSDTNFTDEDDSGVSSNNHPHGKMKLTKRALESELSNSENGQGSGEMKRRRLTAMENDNNSFSIKQECTSI